MKRETRRKKQHHKKKQDDTAAVMRENCNKHLSGDSNRLESST
jgi:hypothetical protein